MFEFVSSNVVFLLGPESVLVASPTFSFGGGIRFRRCYMPEGDRPDGWLGSFGWRVELGAHRSEVARRLGISRDHSVSVETLSDGRLRVASATLVEVTTRDIRLVGERLRPMLGAWSWWNPDAGSAGIRSGYQVCVTRQPVRGADAAAGSQVPARNFATAGLSRVNRAFGFCSTMRRVSTTLTGTLDGSVRDTAVTRTRPL